MGDGNMEDFEDDMYIMDDAEYANEAAAAELADELVELDKKNSNLLDEWNRVGSFLFKVADESKARTVHWWCRYRYAELSRFMLRLVFARKDNSATLKWIKESHRQLGLCTDCMQGYQNSLTTLAAELRDEIGSDGAKKAFQILVEFDMMRFKKLWSMGSMEKSLNAKESKDQITMALFELFSSPRMLRDNRFLKPLQKWISDVPTEVQEYCDFSALTSLPGLFVLSICPDSTLRSWSAQKAAKEATKLTPSLVNYMEELMYVLENDAFDKPWTDMDVPSTAHFDLFVTSGQCTKSPSPQVFWAGLDILFQALDEPSKETLLRRFKNLPDLVFSCLQDANPAQTQALPLQGLLVVTRCYRMLLATLKHRFWEHTAYDPSTVLDVILRQCKEKAWKEFIVIGFLDLLPALLWSLRPELDGDTITAIADDTSTQTYFSTRTAIYTFLLSSARVYANHAVLLPTAVKVLYTIVREAYGVKQSTTPTASKDGDLPGDHTVEIVTPRYTYWWPYPRPELDDARNASCFASEWMEHLFHTIKTSTLLQLVDAAASTISLVLQKHMYLIRDALIGGFDVPGLLSSTWLLDNLCAWKDVEKIPLTVHAALFECVGVTAYLCHVVPTSPHLREFQERLVPYLTVLTHEIAEKGLYNVLKIPAVAQHISMCLISTHPTIRASIKTLVMHGGSPASTFVNNVSTEPINVSYKRLVEYNMPSFCRGVMSTLLYMRSQGHHVSVLKEVLQYWTYVLEGLPSQMFDAIAAATGSTLRGRMSLLRFPRLMHDFFCTALHTSHTMEESYGVRLLRFVKVMWRFWWMFQPRKHKSMEFAGNRVLLLLLRHALAHPSIAIQRRVVDLAMYIIGELGHAKDYASFRLDTCIEDELVKMSAAWNTSVEPNVVAIDVWSAPAELAKLRAAITKLTSKMQARKVEVIVDDKDDDVVEHSQYYNPWHTKPNRKKAPLQYHQTRLFGFSGEIADSKQERQRKRLDATESELEKLNKGQFRTSRTSSKGMTTRMTADTVKNAPSQLHGFYNDEEDVKRLVEERARQIMKKTNEARALREAEMKDVMSHDPTPPVRGTVTLKPTPHNVQRPAPVTTEPEIPVENYKILNVVRQVRTMRVPIAPASLHPFFRQVLLVVSVLAEQSGDVAELQVPGVNFASAGAYHAVFAPLMLEECKSDMVEAWNKVDALKPTRLRLQSEHARDNMRVIVVTCPAKQATQFRNHDVLYLRGVNNADATVGIFVKPERKDRPQQKPDANGATDMQILILSSDDMAQDVMLNAMDEFDGRVLGNLTTAAREYVAMMALDLIPMHLRKVVLSPESCQSTQSLLISMVSDFDKWKEMPCDESTELLRRSLKKLSKLPIQLEDLRSTNIGVAVRKLKKYKGDETIPTMAQQLMTRWQKLLTASDALHVAPVFVPQPMWDVVRPMYNSSQLQSIHSVLSNYESGVSLLQGPPGTGKTKTILGLVAGLLSIQLPAATRSHTPRPAMRFSVQNDGVSRTSIQQIKNQSLSRQRLNGVMAGTANRMGVLHRSTGLSVSKLTQEKGHTNHILICAPSNGAVDELIMRLVTDGIVGPTGAQLAVVPPTLQRASPLPVENQPKNKDMTIVRLGSTADDSPDAVKHVCLKPVVRRNIEIHPKYQAWKILETRENQLRDHIRTFHAQTDPAKKKDKRQMTAWHRELNEVQGKKRRLQDEVQNLEQQITTSILMQANIIVCTLSKCGSGDLDVLTRGFDAVIIDEAAQAVELSTLIPLRERVARAIFVGDPKQLPATVKSVRAQEFLYNRSLFERLAEGGVPRAILRVQYRMHPFLREFPSKCFYGGILNDGDVIGTRVLALGNTVYKHPFFQPFLLFDIDGRESNGPGGSKCNMDEAQFGLAMVAMLYQKIALVRSNRWSIGFITPYKEQVNTLKTLVRQQGFHDVEVNTVDGFQGREKDVIIFSCVRTESIGFLRDLRRLNVGMTRARYCCFVLGNVPTLNRDPTWRQLVDSAASRQLLIRAGRRRFEEVVERMDRDDRLKEHFASMHASLIGKYSNDVGKRKRSPSPAPEARPPKEVRTEKSPPPPPTNIPGAEPVWNTLAKRHADTAMSADN
ncbi:hypothetical protein H310_11240 [Aphanomyces invadans]|uniref:TFIIS N-terminal domain-containing protein n=1 Tax=Aphanomyces invadans TaxID=157072 RepID=A0A024TMI6_9STRA|nr:hypothetical protein H310_11240 [Aphanomyces invadans]ETV95350.1 hypothetical protein H310_11240 [Aphanomyces invadans]|eukprot:XP_008876051.1 hypothetical protein H310_11240 [Aphanomyces invadans]